MPNTIRSSASFTKPARHRTIGPPARVFPGILEFVGDAQLQEHQQTNAERGEIHLPSGAGAPRSSEENDTAQALKAAINGPCANNGKRSF